MLYLGSLLIGCGLIYTTGILGPTVGSIWYGILALSYGVYVLIENYEK